MKSNTIFLDKLSLFSFLLIFANSKITNVLVLCGKNKSYVFFSWILKLKGIKTKNIIFFQGDFKEDDGESSFLFSRRLSSEIAFSESYTIVSNSVTLKNIDFERNSLVLSIAKHLHTHIPYWTDRLSVVSQLSKEYHTKNIFIKQPLEFNSELLSNEFSHLNITFYKHFEFFPFRILFVFIKFKLRSLKRFLFSLIEDRNNNYPSLVTDIDNFNSILSLQEEDIHAEDSNRRQPSWINDETLLGANKHIILRHSSGSVLDVEDAEKLVRQGVYVLPMIDLWKYKKKYKKHKILSEIKNIKKILIRNLYSRKSYIEKYFSNYMISIFSEAELIASLSINYRVKVFLYSDSYFSLNRAMLLVAPLMGIKTIGCQYSNLGSPNPTMLSEPDTMLIFSDAYKKVYKYRDIEPKSFKCYGYINSYLNQKNYHRAEEYRNDMKELGVNFVITYFNESNQKGCFGLTSEEHDLKHLHAFLKLVIMNKDIGLIAKSQFLRSVPSRIYKNDSIIKEALSTGRYLEINHDNNKKIGRNNIYPGEVSLISDLCIAHKYGATAGLEAAVMGARVVLLDTYGIKTIFDEVYSKANIEYQEIEILVDSIIKYKESNLEYSSLGDWSNILHHFNHESQKKSAEILRNQVKKYMLE